MEPALSQSGSPSAPLWVLGLGGAGFAAGFFGPMIFAPDANQGPLVGILLSGPGGAALGLILWGVFRLLRVSPEAERGVLWTCGAALVVVTLYLIMPGPAFHGNVEDVQIQSCKPPIAALNDAVRYWDRRLPGTQGVRPNWREDSRAMLQKDNGVILDVLILREKPIYEERKPWNKGRIVPSAWQAMNAPKTFYASYAGGSCANYAAGTRSLLFNDLYFYDYPNLGWPPRKVPNFLDLQTLAPIPAAYRRAAAS